MGRYGPGDLGGQKRAGLKDSTCRSVPCSLTVLNLCRFVALLSSCLDPNSSQVSLFQLSGLKFLTPHESFRSLTLQLLIFNYSGSVMSQSSPQKSRKRYGASMLLGTQLYLCRVEVLGSGCLQQPLLSVRPQIYPFKTAHCNRPNLTA